MRARRRPPPLHMTSRLPEKIASLNPPFRPTVNDLEPLIIALALEETCNEVSAAMAREGFVPRERHRLSPEDTPVSGAARKRGATFVLDFEPAGLSDDAGLHPLEMALCMCHIVCEQAAPEYTRVTFIAYTPQSDAGEYDPIPSGFASLVQQRLSRVHEALNRKV
jgi:hypothetical protein